MGQALGGMGRLTELRQRLLFLVGALLVYRIGTFIPVPGVNPEALAILFEQNQGSMLDMFNMFSGGALERASLFALGVMPYISASIIVQLMTAVIPQLEQLKKEGESGAAQDHPVHPLRHGGACHLPGDRDLHRPAGPDGRGLGGESSRARIRLHGGRVRWSPGPCS
jgi:hypothetical protein